MASLKRGFEAEEVDDQGAKKIKSADDLFEIRVLIDNYEAAVIIGKGGSNVKNIRTESGSFVSILKTESPVSKERVMTIKGTTDSIATALKLISVILLEWANARKQTDPAGPGAPETGYTFKLLIHKFLAGSIIGKAGAIIKEIMESTKCRLQLSTEPLAGSTEKTVTMTGTPEALHACATRVVDQLVNNPLRAGSSTILYVPGAAIPPFGAMPPYGAPPPPAPSGYNPYAPPPPQQPAYGGYPSQSPYGAPYGAPPPAHGAPPGVAGGVQKVEKIVIPTVCAGTVIGKGGSIIRDIKTQSSCNITIADPEPTAPGDRVVAITGTAAGIQTAIYLIRQRVESYTPPGAPPM